MADTTQLLRRIKTAQNIAKTTRAMQMIAASKLKRAQDAALSSRPYVEKLSAVTTSVRKNVDQHALPVYMQSRKQTGKTLVLVIAPDKGLCGGLVSNLAREVLRREAKNDILITVGKKIESTAKYAGSDYLGSFPFGNTLPSFDVVYPIAQLIDEQYLAGKVDAVEILTTHFESIFTQKPHMIKLLPILPIETEAKVTNSFQHFEPAGEEILPELLKRYLEMVLYQEVIESYLSEQAARMLSMQNATNNAKDIIEDLRLEYNKSRQAKITNELLDITGGAAA
ncbi:MAG: ATP synthase F1 subunit gamma [Patescibacteria group bacterium]